MKFPRSFARPSLHTTRAARTALLLPALSVLLTACPSQGGGTATTAADKPNCTTLHPYGLPKVTKTVTRNCEFGYEGFYWKDGLVPLLAVQSLTPQAINGGAQKEYRLYPDTTIPESAAVTEALYQGTPYIPTQLVTMSDYGGNSRAMGSTLFITNTLPMTPLYAREVWGKLAAATRECLLTQGSAYVFTGALPGAQTVAGKINVPLAFYKVILTADDYRAFLLPNIDTVAGQPLRKFETTLAALASRGLTLAPLWNTKNRAKPGGLCSQGFL